MSPLKIIIKIPSRFFSIHICLFFPVFNFITIDQSCFAKMGFFNQQLSTPACCMLTERWIQNFSGNKIRAHNALRKCADLIIWFQMNAITRDKIHVEIFYKSATHVKPLLDPWALLFRFLFEIHSTRIALSKFRQKALKSK